MNNKQFSKDEDAQVGIGTMIVFIATILVAAVAAGVLIDTSQKLQDKSTRTGSDAINNVGTAFTVLNVWGEDSTPVGPNGDMLLDEMYIDLQLSAGAAPVDLKTLSITYNDGGALIVYTVLGGSLKVAETADNEFWMAKTVRDGDASLSGAVINKDDVVRIGLGRNTDAAANGWGLGDVGTDAEVTLTLTTANGNPVSVSFTTPSHIDANAFVRLF